MGKLILVASFLVQLVCFSFAEIEPRIINGYESRPGQFPFYVFIHTDASAGSQVAACGATLISDRCVRSSQAVFGAWSQLYLKKNFKYSRWVLTAAHCVQKYQKYVLYLGSHAPALFDTQAVSGEIYIHPKASGGVNDVGKLTEMAMSQPLPCTVFFIIQNSLLSL